MELIEDHRAHAGQRMVILKPAQQDAFGDKTNARAAARLVIKANLIADLRPRVPAALGGHARRHGARGHAPGLQHHDHLAAGHPGIQQHLRHLRGLARSRGSHQHQARPAAQRAQDVGVDFPNGERGGSRHGPIPRAAACTHKRNAPHHFQGRGAPPPFNQRCPGIYPQEGARAKSFSPVKRKVAIRMAPANDPISPPCFPSLPAALFPRMARQR